MCNVLGEGTSVEDMEAFLSSIKIVVPEGMVVGVDPVSMQMVNWQYKVGKRTFIVVRRKGDNFSKES